MRPRTSPRARHDSLTDDARGVARKLQKLCLRPRQRRETKRGHEALALIAGPDRRRKLHIWDSKRCASQFCHSKHRLRKNGTPNVRHLIILPFGVFSLFSFSFSYIWEGEMPLLPLCICVSLYTNRLVADRSYRLSRSCLSYRTQP